jgi:septal ring factor EnvC (AmiA/AmiB activator)
MKTDKPREFWINVDEKEETPDTIFCAPETKRQGFVHVIEYTAVDQLEQKASDWKANYEELDLSLCEANKSILLLSGKLTAAETKISTLESSLDKWIATADENDRQRKIAEEKLAAQEREIELLNKFAKHDLLCGIVGGYGRCTCGLEELTKESK